MKGGFQILNFNNLALSNGVEANVKGTFDALKNSNGKRIVCHNLILGDAKYKDFTAYFTEGENQFSTTQAVGNSNLTILVKVGDDVTVTVA